jgi:hypothetical protein
VSSACDLRILESFRFDMALDLVANLVRQATVDSGVAYALRNNPQALRKGLGLSSAHVTALESAEAFPLPTMSLKTTATTQGPADGDLLPPEGVGPEPPGDVQVPDQRPGSAPQKTPRHVPGPIIHPAPRTPGPAVPGIRSTGHGHSPAKHTGPAPLVRRPSGPGQVARPTPVTQRHPAPAQPQQSFGAPLQSTGRPSQATETSGASELQEIVAAATHGGEECNCGCCVSTVAIVASVASTAQTAISAITAIASMGNDS